MLRSVALITGANGEIGRLLVPALRSRDIEVVTVDLIAPPAELRDQCIECVEASILDRDAMRTLFLRHEPAFVFHLAAVLSSKAERDPDLAHRVNVEGTFVLFQLATQIGSRGGELPRFLFPSSIAVYGFPDVETKSRHGAVKENEWTIPAGMYGCNKHYCELVGTHHSRTRPGQERAELDFRAIRFPGLVSAETLPTGGTTDYAPLMIHAAAQSTPYSCFVRPDSRLPFMTMPDGVAALLGLAWAEPERLSTRIYNVRGFSATAEELRDETLRHFPGAKIGFEPVAERQAIVDSWPADIDDAAARRDWGFKPRHGLRDAYADYLVPALLERYGPAAAQP